MLELVQREFKVAGSFPSLFLKLLLAETVEISVLGYLYCINICLVRSDVRGAGDIGNSVFQFVCLVFEVDD